MYRPMISTGKLLHLAGMMVRLVGLVLAMTSCLAAQSSEDEALDRLFAELKTADEAAARQIEHRIQIIWSESGSEAMNLLLARGRQAISDGRYRDAIGHFSALVEQSPQFAEGWNGRATAYFLAGHHDLSLRDIGRTLQLNPRHFGAISGLGMIMEARGEVVAALKAHRMVEELYPNRTGLDAVISRLLAKARNLQI